MATTGALTAGIVGGTLGVVSTLVGSYYGPRRLKEWRAEKAAAPKKECSRPPQRSPVSRGPPLGNAADRDRDFV